MYHCYVTRLKNVRPHPNADKLTLADCFGNTVCVDITSKEGDLGVYFPTDGQLNFDFCMQNNLLRRLDEKADITVYERSGFISYANCGLPYYIGGVIEDEEEITDENGNTSLPKPVKRSLVFLLLSVAFWYMAYNAVTTAFSKYATEMWGMEGGGFAGALMVASVGALISFIPVVVNCAPNQICRTKNQLLSTNFTLPCVLQQVPQCTFACELGSCHEPCPCDSILSLQMDLRYLQVSSETHHLDNDELALSS